MKVKKKNETNLSKSIAGNPLPAVVNEVGDRIGLNYNINRKEVTQKYIDEIGQLTKVDMSNLKNTFYFLNERKTKSRDKPNQSIPIMDKVKNPLKLNSKLRKSLYKLTREERNKLQYSLFELVHHLWLGYASKTINEKDPMLLFRMDLHGCKLRCTASKNPHLVGSEGIVVQETKNTFQIIISTNRLLTLPKQDSLFEFNIHEKLYRINGCNLLFTTQARSKMKYKQLKCWADV